MAVVKANGYGHGAVIAARAFREGGATWFGVTCLEEAVELIDGGIDSIATPILCFAPLVTNDQAAIAIKNNIHVTVCSSEHVQLISQAASENNTLAQVHLKIDTGMGRLGVLPQEALSLAKEIREHSSIELAGVYTHFASANDDNLQKTKAQLSKFLATCESLQSSGITDFVRHCANSSALLRIPESRLDMVRAGTILYGQKPAANSPEVPGLVIDTCTLKTRVVFVHGLPKGADVGYGAEHKTLRPTRTAVLAIGYADGVSMQPASLTRGWRGLRSVLSSIITPKPLTVKFGSFQAPVLGRIAMQMMIVDVTESPTAINIGDIAAVPARRLAIRSSIPRKAIQDDDSK
jgi:alanine racemase